MTYPHRYSILEQTKGGIHEPTREERLETLEAKQGTLEHTLQGVHRSLGILTNVGLKKEMYDREMAENMTMLLGMVSEQQREGREAKTRQERLEAQIASLDTRLASVEQGIATIVKMLGKGTP